MNRESGKPKAESGKGTMLARVPQRRRDLFSALRFRFSAFGFGTHFPTLLNTAYKPI